MKALDFDRVKKTRLVDGMTRYLRLSPPGRSIAVRDADVFVTSYPRSGNTWIRFLLAALKDPEMTLTHSEVQEALPDIYKVSVRKLESMPHPRWLKSHEYFDPRYRRVLYLVRDPRSVAVSYFHHQSRFGLLSSDVTMSSFIRSFVRGDVDGFGSWNDHVLSWICPRGDSPSFLLVRYEDLSSHPLQELTRVADWLELDYTKVILEQALDRTSIEQMKRIEAEDLASRSLGRGTPELTYIGTGRADAWKEELDEGSERLIKQAFAAAMARVGYLEATT